MLLCVGLSACGQDGSGNGTGEGDGSAGGGALDGDDQDALDGDGAQSGADDGADQTDDGSADDGSDSAGDDSSDDGDASDDDAANPGDDASDDDDAMTGDDTAGDPDGATQDSLPDGKWGVMFEAGGAPVEAMFDDPSAANSGYAIPITGLGDERFLELGAGAVVGPGARLRMIPINQTGTFTCGQGPSEYRIVEMLAQVDGVAYSATATQGDCTITVTAVGATYEGSFSGTLLPSDGGAGDGIEITGGAFRNDGSML